MKEITKQIKNSIALKKNILENPEIISQIKNSASIITKAYNNGFKTMIAGNG